MESGILQSGVPKISSFLKRHAICVDVERLQNALPRTRSIITKQKPKPGMAFKVLLQELDRHIDWRFAVELENRFLNN